MKLLFVSTVIGMLAALFATAAAATWAAITLVEAVYRRIHGGDRDEPP